MLLGPGFLCWRVDVGLPNRSEGILGSFTEITMVGLRVGSLANKELLLVLLALRPSLSVPRCHFKQDFHQRGHFYLFHSNSKHLSGLCHVYLLQLGKYFPGSLPGTSPLPTPFLANAAVNVSTFLKRREMVSVRVEIVLVREALDFTSSSNTPLPVTTTPARMSKTTL